MITQSLQSTKYNPSDGFYGPPLRQAAGAVRNGKATRLRFLHALLPDLLKCSKV